MKYRTPDSKDFEIEYFQPIYNKVTVESPLGDYFTMCFDPGCGSPNENIEKVYSLLRARARKIEGEKKCVFCISSDIETVWKECISCVSPVCERCSFKVVHSELSVGLYLCLKCWAHLGD